MSEREPLRHIAKWLTVHKPRGPRLQRAVGSDASPPPDTQPTSAERVEELPFIVRPVNRDDDIAHVLETRARAYGHHLPMFRDLFRAPEQLDFSPGAMLLLAESKTTRAAVGSMRICTNARGQLEVAEHVTLPASLANRALAEASRLSVPKGAQTLLVKLALWKAFFRICLAEQIDTMVVSAKSPVDRDYLMLGFQDVTAGGLWYRHKRFLDVNVHVMQFNVRAAERTWFDLSHRLYDFMFVARHPDIQVTTSPFGQTLPLAKHWATALTAQDTHEPSDTLLVPFPKARPATL